MSIQDLIKSITDCRRIFAFLIVLALAFCSIYTVMMESYTAEIIIKYISNSAEQGLTENRQKINPDEISSTYVVKNAISSLGLKEKSTEKISRNITITPIVPTVEEEKYASWIDNFSDYSNTEDDKKFTVYYSVKYKSTISQTDAEQILNAVINQYRLYYAENYLYNNDITNLSDEATLQYDYYDTVSVLREKISSNISYLSEITEWDYNYRSAATGYSFVDLSAEYQALNERDLSVAERMILENGITKDASYLRDSLQNKATDSQYEMDLNNKKAETQRNLMSIYSEKNQEYLWDDYGTDTDREGTQVESDVERDETHTRNKSVYDNLVLDYVGYRVTALNAEIDKQIYEEDMMSFYEGFSNAELQSEIERKLTEICTKFNNLYEITKNTLTDYNKYKSANSIESTSGIVSYQSTNTIFNYTVSLVIALMLGIIISVFLVYTKKKDPEEDYCEA